MHRLTVPDMSGYSMFQIRFKRHIGTIEIAYGIMSAAAGQYGGAEDDSA